MSLIDIDDNRIGFYAVMVVKIGQVKHRIGKEETQMWRNFNAN